jgi:hypothetical protein
MLYTEEEFAAQMAELIAHGYPDDVAYDLVRKKEMSEDSFSAADFYYGA